MKIKNLSVCHRHVPDPRSISVPSGVDWVVDVLCRRCGAIGGLRLDPSKIEWDEVADSRAEGLNAHAPR